MVDQLRRFAARAVAVLLLAALSLGAFPSSGLYPAFVPPAVGTTLPTFFADFRTEGSANHYWFNGKQYLGEAAWCAAAAMNCTFTRTSAASYTNSAGLVAQALSGVLRFDYDPVALTLKGILLEGASTNLALRSRDLTDVAWTKTNGTAALDQTGADGNATSASSFVATAGNATVLQSIVQGSTLDTYSVYLKRLVGSGEIDITLDGGATWTNITSQINSSTYTRVSAPETVTNSSFGVRVVVNGDKIAADFNQIEALGFASSPIATTTATVTRAADSFTASVSLATTASTILAEAFLNGFGSGLLSINDGTFNNRVDLRTNGSGGTPSVAGSNVTGGGSGISGLTTANNFGTSGIQKVAAAQTSGAQSLVLNGGTVATATGAGTPATLNNAQFGNLDGGSGQPLFADLAQVGYWPVAATNAQLQALTH